MELNKSDIICFGELLLRLSPPGHQLIRQAKTYEANYGGAEANVAASLACLGHKSRFVSRLPTNAIGLAAKSQLAAYGVDTDYIISGGERVGTYFLETGTMHRNSSVIYDRAFSGMATIEKGMINWEDIFQHSQWFHWSGITAGLSATAAEVCMEAIATAKKMGIVVSCDLNYRSKLWQYGKSPASIMPELVSMSDLVLGGKDDARIMLGVEFGKTDDYADTPVRIKEHFPDVKWVATSLRKSYSASHNSIAGVLSDGDKVYRSMVYDMPVMVDRVGGGDAFMAGLIHGMLTYSENYQYIIDFAAAASCLKHTIPGDINLAGLQEIEQLCKGHHDAGRIAR
ncbi:sugar kinase [Limibacter armeniacum]|uniref:sugar kinase n=1 Tax=Limibacter armeniacum TaxID=466084 RepID=UPI002FE5F956